MRRSRLLWILIAVFLLALLAAPFVAHENAVARAEACRARLLAKGEKVNLSDFAPPNDPIAQANGERIIALERSLIYPSDKDGLSMEEIKPGMARIAWQQDILSCNERAHGRLTRDTNAWPIVRAQSESNAPVIEELGRLLDEGGIQSPKKYSVPEFFAEPGFCMGMSSALIDFNEHALLALHEGRSQDAMSDVLHSYSLMKLADNETAMINQMILASYLNYQLATVWELLQYKDWSDAQLAALQGKLEEFDLVKSHRRVIRMECGYAAAYIQECRDSQSFFLELARQSHRNLGDIFATMSGDFRQGSKELVGHVLSTPYYFLWKTIWSYDDQVHCQENDSELFQKLDQAQTNRSMWKRWDPTATAPRWDEEWILSFPKLDAKFLKYPMTQHIENVNGSIQRLRKSQTQLEMTQTAVALERFFRSHHCYPKSLAELAPAYLPRVPFDYMDGSEMRYRLQLDSTFLLYSVGDNGIDEGGDPTPNRGAKPSFSLARDWVWPKPATAQEVEEFEEAESRK